MADGNGCGRRRLDNPEDFVRLEIKAALDRKIRVIPALVSGAAMPNSGELPEALAMLARRNALEISDTRFHHDMDRLIKGLEKVLQVSTSAPPKPDESGRKKRAETTSPPKPKQTIPTRQPFEPELILIQAGEFLMGSDPEQDQEALDEEQPQHRLYLPDYYMAKNPVTNAQFAAFVKAADYRTKAEEAGWSWVWTGKEVEKVSGAAWQHPSGPNSDIAGKSDHPVVQISWHDAVAYCHWLTEVTGQAYRLPTEAEWEKAARGTDSRIHPWGNQWDAGRCNTSEGGQGGTTSVGAYPDGASPYGLLDMAGNVWEWTVSLWGQDWQKATFRYPYNPADGREELKAGDDVRRVLRGGSWFISRNFARCAFRNVDDPPFRDFSSGLRLVSPI